MGSPSPVWPGAGVPLTDLIGELTSLGVVGWSKDWREEWWGGEGGGVRGEGVTQTD